MQAKPVKISPFWALGVFLLGANLSPTAAAKSPDTKPHYTRKKMSFGNLRKLTLEGGHGHYILNNVELLEVSTQSVDLSTADQAFKVRVTLLKSILVSLGQAADVSNKSLLQSWKERIPLVSKILQKHDSFGSIKPLIYDLIEPKGRSDLGLQEELIVLWSADPLKRSKIGDTTLMPPMSFPGQVVDVQYRGLKGGVDQLIGKIVLQILYIRETSKHFLLGGFVIVSRPNGDYEFYLVPRGLLQSIVIETK